MTQCMKVFAVSLASVFGRESLRREEGQTLAEYALILALVALFVAGAIYFLRGQISQLFSDIGSQI